MPKYAIAVTLFGIFALGLPLWAMQYNKHSPANTHGCYGECYEAWKAETGGVVALQVAAAAARAEASPEELGQQANRVAHLQRLLHGRFEVPQAGAAGGERDATDRPGELECEVAAPEELDPLCTRGQQPQCHHRQRPASPHHRPFSRASGVLCHG